MPGHLAFLWPRRHIMAVGFVRRPPWPRSPSIPCIRKSRSGNSSKWPPRPTHRRRTFRPLDPGIVNETIPAFFIGRNKEGFWVARDVNGQIGGIFLFENSAVSFARTNSGPAGCATIYPSERFELDLENSGNPFVVQLGIVDPRLRGVRGREWPPSSAG